MTNTVPVAAMRDQLLDLDAAREILARTEPLSSEEFVVGDTVRFVVEPGWNHGIDAKSGDDLVDAYIRLYGDTEYQLTRDALLEAAAFAGLSRANTLRCPSFLVESHVNYWFREGLALRRGAPRNFQLLVAGGNAAAVTKATHQPFSNLRLVDQALAGIEHRYGKGEVLVDYKMIHNLRRTHLRLIVPGERRRMTGTGVEDDDWSVGIQIRNSLIGDEGTSIDGYLFRWWCTNGAIDTKASSGAYHRRRSATEAEVYHWARLAVDDVLGGLEHAFDAVQATVAIPVEQNISEVLRDLFELHRVPLPLRASIIEQVTLAGEEHTMYSLISAITQVANHPDTDPGHVEGLLRMGGDIPHNDRCGSCNRVNR